MSCCFPRLSPPTRPIRRHAAMLHSEPKVASLGGSRPERMSKSWLAYDLEHGPHRPFILVDDQVQVGSAV